MNASIAVAHHRQHVNTCLRPLSCKTRHFSSTSSRSKPEKNLYKILGLLPTAGKDQIKENYYDLSKRHHPDITGNRIIFDEIKTAYEILSSETARRKYDQELQGQQPTSLLAKAKAAQARKKAATPEREWDRKDLSTGFHQPLSPVEIKYRKRCAELEKQSISHEIFPNGDDPTKGYGVWIRNPAGGRMFLHFAGIPEEKWRPKYELANKIVFAREDRAYLLKHNLSHKLFPDGDDPSASVGVWLAGKKEGVYEFTPFEDDSNWRPLYNAAVKQRNQRLEAEEAEEAEVERQKADESTGCCVM